MKKILLTLMLICASVFSLTLSAQQTLTVADGTTTNSYVPVYGLWMDDYIRAQMIYPANLLSDMVGSTITQLTSTQARVTSLPSRHRARLPAIMRAMWITFWWI